MAAIQTVATDIDMERVRNARVFHTTGYMWDSPGQEDAVRQAVRVARSAHTLVSFDVADPFVVERYHESLVDWIPGNVDLLFANEQELRALTGERGDDVAVLRAAAHLAPTVVMKVGPRGCIVAEKEEIIAADPHPAERADTTGAGDAFASGYLFGVAQRLEARRCAQVANIIAAAIVSVDGCNFDAVDGERVRAALTEAAIS
ncbi:MAG: PfkB family carbohydrate kinase [Spirochaetota bacterium]